MRNSPENIYIIYYIYLYYILYIFILYTLFVLNVAKVPNGKVFAAFSTRDTKLNIVFPSKSTVAFRRKKHLTNYLCRNDVKEKDINEGKTYVPEHD